MLSNGLINLKKRIDSCKRTKGVGLDAALDYIFEVIQLANILGEFDILFLERELDQFMIPQEFSFLIQPKSVRVIPSDFRFRDLKFNSVMIGKKYSYREFINAVSVYRSAMRKDPMSDMVSLDSIRKDVALFDVLPVAGIDGMCNDNGKVYWPIRLEPAVNAIINSNSYLNLDCEVMESRYISNLSF